MKLAVIELDYHAEVLRNLCAGLQDTGIETIVLTTAGIARAAGGPERFPYIRWEIQPEKESVAVFFRRKLEEINRCDVVLFNTLASNFRFFSSLQLRPPTVLRIHNAAAYLQPKPPYQLIPTPFFLFKDISYFFRKMLGENEPRRRAEFVDRVDYLCFPDAAIEQAVRELGWLSGRKTISPLPFTMHESGYQKKPVPGERNITVIGGLDQRRRDYQAVLDAFGLVLPELSRSCSLTLLGTPRGSYGHALQRKFKRLIRPGFRVATYDAFVPQQEFERVLRQTDFLIIPVLEKTRYTVFTENYGRTKISGNIYDMIRYGKPALLPQHYSLDPDVARMAGRYSGTADLARQLQQWIEGESLNARLAAVEQSVARFRPETVTEQIRNTFAGIATA